MKVHLFESWKAWWQAVVSGVRETALGIWHFLSALFFGVVSAIVWLWRKAVGFVGEYPNIALGAFIAITCIVWVLTFVSMRVRAVGAECQRDSIAYQYQTFKEQHGYE